jgi:hypothetical protein
MLTPAGQFEEVSASKGWVLSGLRYAGWAIAAACLVLPLSGHAQEALFTIANFSSADIQLYAVRAGAERLSSEIPAGHPRSHRASRGTTWWIKRTVDSPDVCSFSIDHAMTIVSIDPPPLPSQWSAESLAGFQVMFSPVLLGNREAADEARSFVQDRLADIVRRVPTPVAKHLRGVSLWLDLDPSSKSGAFYANWPSSQHSGRDRDYAGFHGAMYQGVVFRNILQVIARTVRWSPMVVLHELSHAYHDRVLGAWNPEVRRVYEAAKAKGLYQPVRLVNGWSAPVGYALQNEWEYFAVLSEAYFGENYETPHNARDLRSYDPVGHRLVEQAWTGALPTVAPIKMVSCRFAP